MAFKYLDEEMIKKLITSVIQPKLEYAAMIWSQHKKKDTKKIERIQREATKMAPSLRDLPYEGRRKLVGWLSIVSPSRGHTGYLYRPKLPTLEKRRENGDFIAVYKASKGLKKVDREDVCVGRQKYKRRNRGLHARDT